MRSLEEAYGSGETNPRHSIKDRDIVDRLIESKALELTDDQKMFIEAFSLEPIQLVDLALDYIREWYYLGDKPPTNFWIKLKNWCWNNITCRRFWRRITKFEWWVKIGFLHFDNASPVRETAIAEAVRRALTEYDPIIKVSCDTLKGIAVPYRKGTPVYSAPIPSKQFFLFDSVSFDNISLYIEPCAVEFAETFYPPLYSPLTIKFNGKTQRALVPTKLLEPYFPNAFVFDESCGEGEMLYYPW